MNKTKIEWCDYTWNPVTGCKQGCSYCYAKKIAMRFWKDFEPTFHEKRIEEPLKLEKPSKIMVCSMADLFGEWVDRGWIQRILSVVDFAKHHTFMFLTKNPKRYKEFSFPKNCWLGVTMDRCYPDRLKFLRENPNKKFISFEPLLDDMSSLTLKNIDLCIVGAMTGQENSPPKEEWINSIKHSNIFYKNNIKKYLK